MQFLDLTQLSYRQYADATNAKTVSDEAEDDYGYDEFWLRIGTSSAVRVVISYSYSVSNPEFYFLIYRIVNITLVLIMAIRHL